MTVVYGIVIILDRHYDYILFKMGSYYYRIAKFNMYDRKKFFIHAFFIQLQYLLNQIITILKTILLWTHLIFHIWGTIYFFLIINMSDVIVFKEIKKKSKIYSDTKIKLFGFELCFKVNSTECLIFRNIILYYKKRRIMSI